MTFSPLFEHIWLESKKRLPEHAAKEPANIGLRSQYSIRLYGWAKKYEAVITDLPLESPVDRLSLFLPGCLEVAPGVTSDLDGRQSAFGVFRSICFKKRSNSRWLFEETALWRSAAIGLCGLRESGAPNAPSTRKCRSRFCS